MQRWVLQKRLILLLVSILLLVGIAESSTSTYGFKPSRVHSDLKRTLLQMSIISSSFKLLRPPIDQGMV